MDELANFNVELCAFCVPTDIAVDFAFEAFGDVAEEFGVGKRRKRNLPVTHLAFLRAGSPGRRIGKAKSKSVPRLQRSERLLTLAGRD